MGYIEATKKKTARREETCVIRISYKTLMMLRSLIPAFKNECASNYFYRIAGELKRLKEMEQDNY